MLKFLLYLLMIFISIVIGFCKFLIDFRFRIFDYISAFLGFIGMIKLLVAKDVKSAIHIFFVAFLLSRRGITAFAAKLIEFLDYFNKKIKDYIERQL